MIHVHIHVDIPNILVILLTIPVRQEGNSSGVNLRWMRPVRLNFEEGKFSCPEAENDSSQMDRSVGSVFFSSWQAKVVRPNWDVIFFSNSGWVKFRVSHQVTQTFRIRLAEWDRCIQLHPITKVYG